MATCGVEAKNKSIELEKFSKVLIEEYNARMKGGVIKPVMATAAELTSVAAQLMARASVLLCEPSKGEGGL